MSESSPTRRPNPAQVLTDPLPVGIATDFPPRAVFRLIRGGYHGEFCLFTKQSLLEVAAELWIRARPGGEKAFKRTLWALRHRALKRADYDRLFRLACLRRTEAVTIFDHFVRELYDMWPAG